MRLTRRWVRLASQGQPSRTGSRPNDALHRACPVPRSATRGRQICKGYELLSPQKKNVGNGQALKVPVYLLEKLNDGPELEQRGAWLSEGGQAQISRQSCKEWQDSASRWARDAKRAST